MWIAVTVVFWNLENFFDYKADGVSASEMEFSASGKRRWSKKRFYDKCGGVAKTLLLCSETGTPFGAEGPGPDIVGFAEVENAFVMRQLVNSTLLAKLGYGIVHYDSPDPRGIDCALIYRKSRVKLLDSAPCHLLDSNGSIIRTRDILLARFDCGRDTLAVLVNHHPSKLGGGLRETGGRRGSGEGDGGGKSGQGDAKSARRELAMRRMNAICDSLEACGTHRILCIGDFNDDVWSDDGGAKGPGGTIKFNGVWEKIDGHFARGLEVRETILYAPHLLTRDKAFGGLKPLRTYSGPRYLGGLSDHLPVVFEVERR